MIPAALKPLAENDARPVRPVLFQTRASAIGYAKRLACHESRIQRFHSVDFVTDAFQGAEGGKVFQVVMATVDWEVRELSTVDFERQRQSGIRFAIDTCKTKAASHDSAAYLSMPGGAVEALHVRGAKEERQRIRELELLLTVSLARPGGDLADDAEPVLSAERDSRVAL